MTKDNLLKIKTDPASLAKGLSNLIKAKLEKAEKETEEISDKEYKDYVDNNKVSEERLNSIAKKFKNAQPLSKREQAILSYKTSEINELIRNLKKEGSKKPEDEEGYNNLTPEEILDVVEEMNDKKEEEREKLADEYEQAKQRISENIEKNTEEKFKNFDEKIGVAYNRTEKVAQEVKEKYNQQIQDLKNKIDSGFKEPEVKTEERERDENLEKDIKEGDINEINKIINEIDEKFIKSEEIVKKLEVEPKPIIKKTLNELEEANNKASKEYFDAKNKKPKKGGFLGFGGNKKYKEDLEIYKMNVEDKEKNYSTSKKEYAKKLLSEGKTAEAKEFIMQQVEQKRKNDIENGPLHKRVIKGISKGIKYWEEIGNNPEDTKTVRLLKKTGKTLAAVAIIGGASAGIVSSLAAIGVGSAAALSAGAGTYLGRRMIISLGFSTAMAVVPDSLKPFAGKLAVGLAATSIAGAVGYGASKLTSFATKRWWSEKAIADKAEKKLNEKTKEINLDTLDENLEKYEEDCAKIIKQAENKRVYRRLLAGAVALGSSVAFLEVAGHKIDENRVEKEQEIKHREATMEKGIAEQKEGENVIPIKTDANTAEKNQEQNINDNTQKENAFHGEKVEISSRGAIQTIEDLKEKIRTDYNNDFSKAPVSVQEFMNTDSTKEAIKLGFYNPDSPSESAMMLKGSTLEFDEHGNLTVHDIKTGEDSTLIHGEEAEPQIEKYHGQMFDSDKNMDHTHDVPDNQNEYVAPEQVTPATGEVIDQNNINNTTEVNGDTYNLTEDQVEQVNQFHQENINHLFGDDNVLWNNLKDSHQENLTADKMINYHIIEGTNEDTRTLVTYLNRLHEVTGLNPFEKTLITPAETNSEFMYRAELKAEEMGLLDKIKL